MKDLRGIFTGVNIGAAGALYLTSRTAAALAAINAVLFLVLIWNDSRGDKQE